MGFELNLGNLVYEEVMDHLTAKFIVFLQEARKNRHNQFILNEVRAFWCKEEKPTFTKFWNACERGEWMLWVAYQLGISHETRTLATCACAREALSLLKDPDPRLVKALDAAESWASGGAGVTREELNEVFTSLGDYPNPDMSQEAKDMMAVVFSGLLSADCTPVLATKVGCKPAKLAELVRQHLSEALVTETLVSMDVTRGLPPIKF